MNWIKKNGGWISLLLVFAMFTVAQVPDQYPRGDSQVVTAPANDAETLTMDQNHTLPRVSRALRNNSEDVVDINVRMRSGVDHLIEAIQPGDIVPYRVDTLYDADTTATSVEVLY
jgi:hypothetical protein